MSNMTLTQATEKFADYPSTGRARDLLRVAVQYHDDGMIEDTTLHSIIYKVAAFLDGEVQ
jgi:hypothetical protein